MKVKNKSHIFIFLLISITLFCHLVSPLYASSLALDEKTNYVYTGISPFLGHSVTHYIHVLKMDHKKVFCVESGIGVSVGEGYISESYIDQKKEKLSKIAYYGYTATKQTHYDYAVTQIMIWEELGDRYQSSNIPNYLQRKQEIMDLVDRHETRPSWHESEVTLTPNQPTTITDTNHVFANMTLVENNTGVILQSNDNNLTLTPNNQSHSGTLIYQKIPSHEVGTSIIYRKPKQQSMVEFHLENATQATLQLNIKQNGQAVLIKEDSQTGSTPQGKAHLDGAIYELRRTSDDQLIQEVTIKNGCATVSDLTLDQYYWIETKAPKGYLLDSTKYHFKLTSEQLSSNIPTHNLTVKETVISGHFDIKKLANYNWQNATTKSPLNDVEFSVYSDTTGQLVQKGLTDNDGYLQFTDLPYDTYTVKETKTPEGYIAIDDFKVTITNHDEHLHYTIDNKVIEEKLKIIKVDIETDKAIPRSDALFQIKNLQTGKLMTMPDPQGKQTDTFFTDSDGSLLLTQPLPYGDYELIEVQAPKGYICSSKPIPFKIDGSHQGLLEIRFKDLAQKGLVKINKTGSAPINIEVKSSDYGDLYQLIYKDLPVANVTYQITALEDIITNDGTTHAKKGAIVATMTTNQQGECSSQPLYLGKYQAIETSAPKGFVLDPTPIPFELTYADQSVELTSTALTAVNDFQSLDISLFKNEEVLIDWKKGQPYIEVAPANKQIFGLFTRDSLTISEQIKIPKDSLITYQSVSDGLASFKLKLPQGNYYLKELDSGNNHQINNTEYDFSFTAENNQATFPIHIYHNNIIYGKDTLQSTSSTPILNKLIFNELTVKKSNEKAIFDKENGLYFNFDSPGSNAIFTLEDSNGTVLQEVTIDNNGIGNFKNIPVGIFYLKEKSPSSDDYILLKNPIKIESLKSGIKAYDSNNQLLGESKESLSLELKNYLVKGDAQLTKKDVSSGELLPNTGVHILDQDKNILIAGRTNEQGILTFKNLPKGQYYFQEFDAPKGYELDETPIPFEIKDNGEIIKCRMTNKKASIEKTQPNTNDATNLSIHHIIIIFSLIFIGLLKGFFSIVLKKRT